MKYVLENQSLEQAEAALTPIIKYWIVELMACGGTTPEATCDYIAEEEPDLYNALGHERVRELCEELHRFENTTQSEWYGVRFYQFNREYFDGRLGDYRVRVGYDVDFWLTEPLEELQRSHIDLGEREIILGATQDGGHIMEVQLLHHMAHAATGTSTDDDPRWLQEMERLRDLGAPVVEEVGAEL
jgi:hypothetical protein